MQSQVCPPPWVTIAALFVFLAGGIPEGDRPAPSTPKAAATTAATIPEGSSAGPTAEGTLRGVDVARRSPPSTPGVGRLHFAARCAEVEARIRELRAAFRLRDDDHLDLLEDGRCYIIQRCSGRVDEEVPAPAPAPIPLPYTLWYLLGSSDGSVGACGPPGWGCGPVPQWASWLGGGWQQFTSAPYAFSSYPPPIQNPNNLPVNPLHGNLNLTRHWAPAVAPLVTVHARTPSGTQGSNIFAIGSGLTYSWQSF